VFNLYLWYKSIPTYVQEQCDSGVLKVLLDTNLDLDSARAIACSVVDIVGGPTAAQSAFVTTIIGLSTGIFGLYVATGRKWDGSNNMHHNPFEPSNQHYGPRPHHGPSFGPRRRPDRPPNAHDWNNPPTNGPWGDADQPRISEDDEVI
jgi:hypothetical protein